MNDVLIKDGISRYNVTLRNVKISIDIRVGDHWTSLQRIGYIFADPLIIDNYVAKVAEENLESNYFNVICTGLSDKRFRLDIKFIIAESSIPRHQVPIDLCTIVSETYQATVVNKDEDITEIVVTSSCLSTYKTSSSSCMAIVIVDQPIPQINVLWYQAIKAGFLTSYTLRGSDKDIVNINEHKSFTCDFRKDRVLSGTFPKSY